MGAAATIARDGEEIPQDYVALKASGVDFSSAHEAISSSVLSANSKSLSRGTVHKRNSKSLGGPKKRHSSNLSTDMSIQFLAVRQLSKNLTDQEILDKNRKKVLKQSRSLPKFSLTDIHARVYHGDHPGVNRLDHSLLPDVQEVGDLVLGDEKYAEDDDVAAVQLTPTADESKRFKRIIIPPTKGQGKQLQPQEHKQYQEHQPEEPLQESVSEAKKVVKKKKPMNLSLQVDSTYHGPDQKYVEAADVITTGSHAHVDSRMQLELSGRDPPNPFEHTQNDVCGAKQSEGGDGRNSPSHGTRVSPRGTLHVGKLKIMEGGMFADDGALSDKSASLAGGSSNNNNLNKSSLSNGSRTQLEKGSMGASFRNKKVRAQGGKKDFLEIGTLGSGASGVVSEAVHIPSMTIVALKMLPVYNQQKRQHVSRELGVLYRNLADLRLVDDRLSQSEQSKKSAGGAVASSTTDYTEEENNESGSAAMMGSSSGGGKCPNVLSLYNAFVDPKSGMINLVVEYMDGGSLEDLVQQGGCTDEIVLADIAAQTCEGLAFLHKNKQMHRDIKPANILCSSSGLIKIADFGISKALDKTTGFANSFVGTVCYMSPERITGESYTFTSDIWSLGLTILAVAQGRFPLTTKQEKKKKKKPKEDHKGESEGGDEEEEDEKSVVPIGGGPGGYWAMIKAICDDEPPCPGPEFSPEFNDFIACCLRKESSERLTAKQLLDLPFVTERELADDDEDEEQQLNNNNINNVSNPFHTSDSPQQLRDRGEMKQPDILVGTHSQTTSSVVANTPTTNRSFSQAEDGALCPANTATATINSRIPSALTLSMAPPPPQQQVQSSTLLSSPKRRRSVTPSSESPLTVRLVATAVERRNSKDGFQPVSLPFSPTNNHAESRKIENAISADGIAVVPPESLCASSPQQLGTVPEAAAVCEHNVITAIRLEHLERILDRMVFKATYKELKSWRQGGMSDSGYLPSGAGGGGGVDEEGGKSKRGPVSIRNNDTEGTEITVLVPKNNEGKVNKEVAAENRVYRFDSTDVDDLFADFVDDDGGSGGGNIGLIGAEEYFEDIDDYDDDDDFDMMSHDLRDVHKYDDNASVNNWHTPSKSAIKPGGVDAKSGNGSAPPRANGASSVDGIIGVDSLSAEKVGAADISLDSMDDLLQQVGKNNNNNNGASTTTPPPHHSVNVALPPLHSSMKPATRSLPMQRDSTNSVLTVDGSEEKSAPRLLGLQSKHNSQRSVHFGDAEVQQIAHHRAEAKYDNESSSSSSSPPPATSGFRARMKLKSLELKLDDSDGAQDSEVDRGGGSSTEAVAVSLAPTLDMGGSFLPSLPKPSSYFQNTNAHQNAAAIKQQQANAQVEARANMVQQVTEFRRAIPRLDRPADLAKWESLATQLRLPKHLVILAVKHKLGKIIGLDSGKDTSYEPVV